MINGVNLYTLLYSLIIVVATAVLSSYLTIRKYRTDRWWDRKSESYIGTIKAMNNIIIFCDDVIAKEYGNKAKDKAVVKQLKNEFNEASILVETQLNIGKLFLSKDSYKDLLDLDRVFSDINIQDVRKVANLRVVTEDIITSFIFHAKKDLSIKHF